MSQLVLIVEDDPGLRTIYQRVLRDTTCDTIEAANAIEALNILADTVPSVIFLDMMLPQLNGEAVLEYTKNDARFEDTKIVIVSSNKQYERFALQEPKIAFVLKPIRPDQIRSYVNHAFV